MTNATIKGKNVIIFTVDGIDYIFGEKPGYNYKIVDGKKIRISAKEINDAARIYNEDQKAEAEYQAKKEKAEQDAKATEDAFNGTESAIEAKVEEMETKAKKTKKRKSKDIAFAVTITLADDKIADVTLTKKQVDFINALPGTSFYENGLDSTLWCDCIAQDIGWNPMGVGAMISTLREKDLVVVVRDDSRQGKPKAMNFTELGKAVAKALGLK